MAANLTGAYLFDAGRSWALLPSATLRRARWDGGDLTGAHLGGATLRGADLRGTRMDGDTALYGARFESTTRLADVVWNGTPLTTIDWDEVAHTGDEAAARHLKGDRSLLLQQYRAAARANRQLATALRGQGLTEPADR
jgi:uncharacterized protein YjbI with pentapeptide repeats